MSIERENWELRQGETLIGTLKVSDHDMFWFDAQFESTEAFEPYRALFAEGQSLTDEEQTDDWGLWLDKTNKLGMSLVRLRDAEIASEFILYINDDRAYFRPSFDRLQAEG
jgi:hypothetical protein